MFFLLAAWISISLAGRRWRAAGSWMIELRVIFNAHQVSKI
jgi:hypothetical protein